MSKGWTGCLPQVPSHLNYSMIMWQWNLFWTWHIFFCVALVKSWKLSCIENNVEKYNQHASALPETSSNPINSTFCFNVFSELLSYDHYRYSTISQASVINGYIVGVCSWTEIASLSKLISRIEWKMFILTNQLVLLEKSQLDLLIFFLTAKAWITWHQNMNQYK